METLSTSLALCWGNPPATGGFPKGPSNAELCCFLPVVSVNNLLKEQTSCVTMGERRWKFSSKRYDKVELHFTSVTPSIKRGCECTVEIVERYALCWNIYLWEKLTFARESKLLAFPYCSCISGSCGLRYPQLLPGSREPSDQERRIGLRSFGDHILKHWNIGHCQDEVIIIVTAKYREVGRYIDTCNLRRLCQMSLKRNGSHFD